MHDRLLAGFLHFDFDVELGEFVLEPVVQGGVFDDDFARSQGFVGVGDDPHVCAVEHDGIEEQVAVFFDDVPNGFGQLDLVERFYVLRARSTSVVLCRFCLPERGLVRLVCVFLGFVLAAGCKEHEQERSRD